MLNFSQFLRIWWGQETKDDSQEFPAGGYQQEERLRQVQDVSRCVWGLGVGGGVKWASREVGEKCFNESTTLYHLSLYIYNGSENQ